MKTLNYDRLTESQQEQVESLIADMEGRRENNSSNVANSKHFVAVIGDDCDKDRGDD